MSPPRDRRIPDLVSASEAASMLGVTRQAVQLMANNGQLLGAKAGATWVFRRALVEAEAGRRRERDGPPLADSDCR
jgi:hypothetical protein